MSRDAEDKMDPKAVRLLDKRTVERNIKKGLLSRKDYEKHLKSLADIADKGVYGGPLEDDSDDDDLMDDALEAEDEAEDDTQEEAVSAAGDEDDEDEVEDDDGDGAPPSASEGNNSHST
jgi:hypothetical protein